MRAVWRDSREHMAAYTMSSPQHAAFRRECWVKARSPVVVLCGYEVPDVWRTILILGFQAAGSRDQLLDPSPHRFFPYEYKHGLWCLLGRLPELGRLGQTRARQEGGGG